MEKKQDPGPFRQVLGVTDKCLTQKPPHENTQGPGWVKSERLSTLHPGRVWSTWNLVSLERLKKTQPRRTVQMAVEVKLTTRAQQLHSPFHPREMKTYHHSMAPYLESLGW